MPSFTTDKRNSRATTRPTPLSSLRRVAGRLLVVLMLITQTNLLLAQGPGGGRGGRGGPGGGGMPRGDFGFGLIGMLWRSEVKEELKITADQEMEIGLISQGSMPDFAVQNERRKAATTDEAKAKLEDEFRLEREQRRKKNEEKLKTLLKPEQYTRLEQLYLQDAGLAALRYDNFADRVKLTSDQKKQVQQLQGDYEKKSMEGGFFMSREDREKLRTDRDGGLQKILTADQKKQWDGSLGPPALKADDNDRSSRRGGGSRFGSGGGSSGGRDEKAPEGATVVADFAGGTSADSKLAGIGNKTMQFNFEYAPWEMVLKQFAKRAGLTLDMNVTPTGTFNYIDPEEHTLSQAMDVLNGHLSLKGYLLIRRDKSLVVVRTDNIPPNLVPQVSLQNLPNRGRYELVSVLLPLQDIDPELAADEAQELLGPQGKAVPFVNTGKLLVTDLAENVQRIHDLLNGGSSGPIDGPVFRTYPIKHISVVQAEEVVRDLFGLAPRSNGRTSTSTPTTTNSNNNRGDRGDRGGDQPRWGGFGGWGGGGWGGGGGPGGWGGFMRDRGGDGGRDEGRGGRGGNRGDDNNNNASRSQATQQAANSMNARVQVATDLRTNTLMVTAKPDDHKVIESALKTLDIDEQTNNKTRNLTGRNSPNLDVYAITTADPLVVIDTIANVVPSAIVSEDTKAKRLLVFATLDEHRQIKALIEQIDGGVEGAETMTVLPLKKTDPVGAALTLRSLYKGNQDDAPSIEADALGRRLIVRGTTAQVNEIKDVLRKMGEDPDGTGLNSPSDRGPMRTLSTGGRDPRELVELLKQVWPSQDANPIRIVVPSAVAPMLKSGSLEDGKTSRRDSSLNGKAAAITTKTVNENRTTPADEDSAKEPEFDVSDLEALFDPKTVDQSLEDVVEDVAIDDAAEPEDAEEVKDEKPATAGDAAANGAKKDETAGDADLNHPADKQILISPFGNNLIISSNDLEALDRLQTMVEALTLAAPKHNMWTVFYLRTADATETATMLGHLFPSGSVSRSTDANSSTMMGSLTGGISSFGSSLMDMTGLSNLGAANALRIVPETRSNALYVSGPSDLVRQVEDVLKVLDTSELPESLRDRVPRMIPVEHADVEEVAEILENVYKDYLQAPAATPGGGGGGGFNPLAMLMQGASGGNDPKAKRGIRLTIGVDTRTNSIVASADDALFRQVETLVKNLDQAALDAHRTIRVMNVNASSSHLVQQALGSLLGKVKVSSTGGGGSSAPVGGDQPFGGGDQGGGRGRNRGGDGQQRDVQQEMRQRFIQGLMQQQGGGQGGQGGNGGGNGGGGFGGRGGRGGRGGFGGGGGFGNGGGGGGNNGGGNGGGRGR